MGKDYSFPRPGDALMSKSNSAEAAIALRQRLNETVEQFEALRNEHAELQVKFEDEGRQLTIAKSNRE
jgi:protein HOOK3